MANSSSRNLKLALQIEADLKSTQTDIRSLGDDVQALGERTVSANQDSATSWRETARAQTEAMRAGYEAALAEERQAEAAQKTAEAAAKAAAEHDKEMKALQKLLGTLNETERALNLLDEQELALTRHFNAGRLELEDYNDAMEKIGQQRNALTTVADDAGKANSEVSGLTRSVKQLVGVYASFRGVQKGFDIATQFRGQESRLKAAIDEADELAQVQERLFDISDRARQPLANTQDQYIQIARSMRDLGFQTDSTLDYLDSLNGSLLANEVSASKVTSVFNALNSAQTRGYITTENATTIFRELPTALADVARYLTEVGDGTEITQAAVQKLAKEGRLSFDTFVQAMIAAKDRNAELADQVDNSVGIMNRFYNRLGVAINDLNNATGATDKYAAAVQFIIDNMDALTRVVGVVAVAALTKYTAALLLATAGRIKKSAADVKGVIAEYNAARAAAATTAANLTLAKSHAAAAAATEAHGAAQTRLATATKGMLALVGGPAGIAALVATAAAGFFLFRDSAKAAESGFNDLNESLDTAIDRLQKLTTAEQASALAQLEQETVGKFRTMRGEAVEFYETLRNSLQWQADTDEARQRIRELADVFGASVMGIDVSWGHVAQSVKNMTGISDELRAKLLQGISEQARLGRETDELRSRYDALSGSISGSSNALDENNSRLQRSSAEAEKLLKKMARQIEDVQDPTARGRLLRDLRDNPDYQGIPQETINQLLAAAEAQDKLAAAKKAEQEQNKRGKNDNENYVKNLEKQAAALTRSSAQMREYELAQRNLTPELKARAQAALELLTAEEKLAQIKINTGLVTEFLTATGDETGAAILEMQTKFAEMRQQFIRDGNETGIEWINRLIPVSEAKIRLDDINRHVTTLYEEMAREEQSIQAQLDAKLITEWQARRDLVAVHQQTAAAVQQYVPALKELATLSGPAGDSARALLADLDTRLISLKNTANELQTALRSGLSEGIKESIRGLIDDDMDIRDALTTIVNSIASSILDSVIQNLADTAVNGLMGLFSSTAEATATATTIGTAITTSGTAAATNMSVGVTSGGNAAAAAMATAITGAGTTAGASMAAAITAASAGSSGGSAAAGILSSVIGAIGSAYGGGAGAAGGAMVGAAFNSGGLVSGPGTGTSDSIIIRASDGEFITREAVTSQPGALPFLKDFNRYGMSALNRYLPRHATGGIAGLPETNLPAPKVSANLPAAAASRGDTTLENKQNFIFVDSPERITEVAWGTGASDRMVYIMSKDPQKFRSIFKI